MTSYAAEAKIVAVEEEAEARWRDGSYKFLEILDRLETLHRQKQNDYGQDGDPYANVRASEGFGMPAWLGVAVRMQDKMKRLQTAGTQYIKQGGVSLSNESLEDTFLDLAVYAIIGLVMLEEEK